MKIAGFLIILNSLVVTGWWVCTDHQYKSWAITIGLLTMFAGIFLIVQDRAIEVTIEKVGTIKAAAQQATEDAEAIGELRERIQNQSATIDLIAESSSKAHKLVEDAKAEILEIKKQVKEAAALASPPTLLLTSRNIEEDASKYKLTLQFTPSKNEPLGTIIFVIYVENDSNAKILDIWPSLKGGAFSSGDDSKKIDPNGKRGQLIYSLISAGRPTIDLTLSQKATIKIEGNYIASPIIFNQ